MSWINLPITNPPVSNLFGAIYTVYTGGQFPTIQSAIDQAKADGHVDAITSSAAVVVYPGTWIGDVTMSDGISVVGYVGKGKDYTVEINGQVSYTPGSLASINNATVKLQNLRIFSNTGKNCVKLTGSNVGKIFIEDCIISKLSGTDSVILMNGNASSEIEIVDSIDGNVSSGAAGATIYDIQSGTLTSYGSLTIGSVYAGKIINCGATGTVNVLNLAGNCTGNDAITIATGGTVTLSLSSVTNNQANSNGANIASGGTLNSFNCLWNIPSGTGKCIFGVAGSVWVYAANSFVTNKTYSTAIGAGAVALASTPVAG